MSEHIALVVNGQPREGDVEPRRMLVQFLREDLELTGTHVGCDTSQCGACTVHVDGKAVKSCTMLAVQADGATVKTIEGLAGADGALHPLQRRSGRSTASSAGSARPGMIMAAADLLARNADPTDDEIRHAIEGNICRCTGYHNIVAAIREAAATMRAGRHGAARRPPAPRAEESDDGTDVRRPRRPGQAGRGPALHHRQGPLSRRHQADRDGPHGHPPQPVRPREHPLDRHVGGEDDARRPRGHRRRRHPVQPAADGLAGRRLVRDPEQRQHARASSPPTPSSGPARASPRSSPRRRSRRSTRSSAIQVDYEPLPAVVDAEKATQPGAPQLHENAPNNVVFDWPVGDKAGTDKAFDDAEVVVKQRLVNHRLIPNPMEVRGDIGLYNPGTEEYTVWMSSQTPHIQRLLLTAFVTGIPEHKVRCISPDVGGAFGTKIFCYADMALVMFASKLIGGRPVKWVESRRESYGVDDPRPRPHHLRRDRRRSATARSPASGSRRSPTSAAACRRSDRASRRPSTAASCRAATRSRTSTPR